MAREYVTETGKPWEGNRRESEGYRYLMTDIRMQVDPGDAYGWSMGVLGNLAAAAYMYDGTVLPGYGPSIMHNPGEVMEGDEYEQARWIVDDIENGNVTMDDVRRVYAIVDRYNDWVRLAGRDY